MCLGWRELAPKVASDLFLIVRRTLTSTGLLGDMCPACDRRV